MKVSSLRSNRDLTHWRPAAFNGYGTGGWWNFGGLLREVYVRKIDTIDIEDVHVLPHLPKVGGPAKVDVRAYLRNMTSKAREVDLVLSVDGQRIVVKGKRVPAEGVRILTKTFTIERPRLWQPGKPELYPMTVAVDEGKERRADYRLRFGVRKLEVAPGGVILLNGRRLDAARREHPRGRPQRGRRAVAAHALPAGLAPARPRRHDHALALPAPPRLHRGLRQVRDPLLGRRARLPAAEQPSSTSRACGPRPSARSG